MSRKLAIIGAGGLGHETLALIRQLNRVDPQWDVIGFCDDRQQKGQMISGVPVIGTIAETISGHDLVFVIAVGDPVTKEEIVGRVPPTVQFATLIHPSAIIADDSIPLIGRGSIITAGAKLTTEIRLGMHVLVNLNATIGHETAVGDFTSIMPGVNIGGNVRIGAGVLVGSGATIVNKVTLGDHAKVGAGAVVISNVERGITVVGVPARSKHSS